MAKPLTRQQDAEPTLTGDALGGGTQSDSIAGRGRIQRVCETTLMDVYPLVRVGRMTFDSVAVKVCECTGVLDSSAPIEPPTQAAYEGRAFRDQPLPCVPN